MLVEVSLTESACSNDVEAEIIRLKFGLALPELYLQVRWHNSCFHYDTFGSSNPDLESASLGITHLSCCELCKLSGEVSHTICEAVVVALDIGQTHLDLLWSKGAHVSTSAEALALASILLQDVVFFVKVAHELGDLGLAQLTFRIVTAQEPCRMTLQLTVRVGEELEVQAAQLEAIRHDVVDVANNEIAELVLLTRVADEVVAFVALLVYKRQPYKIW